MFTLHPILARDTFTLGHFELCQLLLMNDCNHPWFILVPRVDNVQEIFQLSPRQQNQLMTESSHLGSIIQTVFRGDKLNIAALGNVCSQLHLHHIVRYKSDPAWPAPVWGKIAAKPYNEKDKTRIIEQLQSRLTEDFTWQQSLH